ncbi:MAG: glycoside hydrolase family 95-like protein [Bacteroidota bacterium]
MPNSANHLNFNHLPTSWDEGIPLGNGMIGALIWEKEGKLRFSLDRVDLWDLRPMENLNTPKWKYSWVYDQWKKDQYAAVQQQFDVPYDQSPAPSKIPGAALEFDISSLGEVQSVDLDLDHAICEIHWKNGVKLMAFVHATKTMGWYRFEGLKSPLPFTLLPPAYSVVGESEAQNPVTGQDLRRLGYPKGQVVKSGGSVTYDQEGWGGFQYQVSVGTKPKENAWEGCWSISSAFPGWEKTPLAEAVVRKMLPQGMTESLASHTTWWHQYWSKSSIQVPDSLLQRQWLLEQYKFGSAARAGAPPVSLQAVWTADNGKLPPWKGDFHHDLNTQLSYWPAYSANHLDEEMGFIDWLWKYRETFKSYTKEYYETDGLNVPGVTTLIGEPMGGWIQYSFGPTVSAWLAHHFYLHWRYTMDREFLAQKAYPWIKDVALHFEKLAVLGENDMLQLPISSSPEIHNNGREAWFAETTNFDLALIRWTYEKAAELAGALQLPEEKEKWKTLLAKWPQLAVDGSGLLLAPHAPLEASHRHFSHLLGYHPLGIVDFSKGGTDEEIIKNTIRTLDSLGSSQWVGYSFSWLGNAKARAFDGEGAAQALKTFASAFCLANSFHVNGDQSGKGYSSFTYRPFTLEGNFAFAAGLQEMLIQSHTGTVQLFPAIPKDWKDVRFDQLRTEGAFLVSAEMKDGLVRTMRIKAEKGGELLVKSPFGKAPFECSMNYRLNADNILVVALGEGETVHFSLIRS